MHTLSFSEFYCMYHWQVHKHFMTYRLHTWGGVLESRLVPYGTVPVPYPDYRLLPVSRLGSMCVQDVPTSFLLLFTQ